MRNYQAQIPHRGQTKMTETIAKQKTNTSKIKTATMINDITRRTTGIGEIQERHHRFIHLVRILNVKSQVSG